MNFRLIDHEASSLTVSYLVDLYELTNRGNETVYGCVPNGELGITIILSGESFVEIEGQWVRQPQAAVYGLIRRRQFIMMSPNYREISIGFFPHIFQLFMKESMSSLVKYNATDLYFLFDKYVVERLVSGIAAATSDGEMLHHIEIFLRECLDPCKEDKRLRAAHNLIYNSGMYSVNDLCHALNISSTTLRGIFQAKIGLTPKELIKIARIRKALNYRNSDEETLTTLAYDLKYFDQAHFIHDFQNAIGLTPSKYFKNKDLTFDFYNFRRWQFSSFAEK